MNGFNSIGDLSLFVQLRQSNASLKSRLTVLSQELSTQQKADISAATGGNLGRLAQVQTRLTMLDSFSRNASLADTQLDALQSATGAISTIAEECGPDMLTVHGAADDSALNVRAAQAQQDFQAVVRLINTDVGGRFALSGTAVTTAPLSSPQDILDLARARVAGLTDPATITAALDDWFDSSAPDGFGSVAFHGNTTPTTTGVSHETTVTHDVNALDPSLRSILKGLALAAIGADQTQGLSRENRAAVVNNAGQRVVMGRDALTAMRAQIGMRQEIVAKVATRNAAEISALGIARSDILAADPYETASALTQTEASLQNLYSLTARLSRLSLTDYL